MSCKVPGTDTAAAGPRQHASPLLAAERALLHHESPFAAVFLPNHDTPLVIREGSSLERAGTLIVVPHHSRVIAHCADNDLGARAVIQPIARGTDDRQNGQTIEGRAVRGNIDVILVARPLTLRRRLTQPALQLLPHLQQ